MGQHTRILAREKLRGCQPFFRTFSTTHTCRRLLDVNTLSNRIYPRYEEVPQSSFLALRWPEPPRNILIVPKLYEPRVMQSTVIFAKHLARNYPNIRLVLERRVAETIHKKMSCPLYTTESCRAEELFPMKIDLVTTLGGDGTVLRAASLFSFQQNVPPVLSFSMGSLGFLGEWKFEEYKRAWREVYMSGSGVTRDDQSPISCASTSVGDSVHGQDPAVMRVSRMLLRNRLKVRVYNRPGSSTAEKLPVTVQQDSVNGNSAVNAEHTSSNSPYFHAINELLIHRGPHPHLAVIDIFLNDHFLTEAVADGILVSTPTGSTAYSLSAGGSIIHPLVGSLLITPICPRSLSFRPLVLPLNTKVSLRISKRNRCRELEVSIDGKRKTGASIGMDIYIEGEPVGRTIDGSWRGGVPCVIRAPSYTDKRSPIEDDGGWVGGLNGLLKFNYPFGQDPL